MAARAAARAASGVLAGVGAGSSTIVKRSMAHSSFIAVDAFCLAYIFALHSLKM
jgi:hypothetical protein